MEGTASHPSRSSEVMAKFLPLRLMALTVLPGGRKRCQQTGMRSKLCKHQRAKCSLK